MESNASASKTNITLPHLSTGALSVSDFCKRYAIGRSMAYEEHKRGRLKFRKVGNRTLILCGDAERWAESLPESVK